MKVKLVTHTPKPERAIELAYLSCRNLDPWKPKSHRTLRSRIQSMWHSGHLSPFEFADATFYISGVSRSCSHQFVRHRIASYEQLSMRHIDVGDLEVIVPPSVKELQSTKVEDIENVPHFLFRGKEAYKYLGSKKVPKEDARFYIPIGIETRFMAKMNFRSWAHFLRLRLHPSAQWEIRGVAEEILKHLQTIAPNVFADEYRCLWE